MQKNHLSADKGNRSLTPDERKEVIASRPDMSGPKAAIDAAAWGQVEKILNQRKLQQAVQRAQ